MDPWNLAKSGKPGKASNKCRQEAPNRSRVRELVSGTPGGPLLALVFLAKVSPTLRFFDMVLVVSAGGGSVGVGMVNPPHRGFKHSEQGSADFLSQDAGLVCVHMGM